MGNQLCPATTKDLILEFSEIQKGETTYQALFKGCFKTHTQDDREIDLDPYMLATKQGPSTLPNSQVITREIDPYEPALPRIPRPLSRPSSHSSVEERTINAELLLEDGGRYVGETKGGVPNGQGEEFYAEGEHYKGGFLEGLKNGKGVYTFSNGETYTGEFKQNLMWGFGVFRFKNGDVYEGQFQQNVRSGQGKYIPKQPNREGILYFQGHYLNDLKQGPGRVVYSNYQLSGTWRNGLYNFKLPSNLTK